MGVGRAGRLLLGVVVLAVVVGPATPRPDARPDPPRPGPVRPVAVAPSPAPSPAPSRAPKPPERSGGPLSVLQLNLCNSGMAGCYQGGRSVPEAAAVIAAVRPDVVTVDEICRRNLTALGAAMRQAFPGQFISWHFQPVHGRDDSISSCVDGDEYGIGIAVHLRPGSPRVVSRGAEYPDQQGRRGERRVWECLYLTGTGYICATHLAAFNGDRALAQCRYLMNTAIPQTQARLGGYFPTVVGGDLNLTDQGSPNTSDCLPAGWLRTGDGAFQHVLATADHTVVSVHRLAMTYTDHPALLVTLRSAEPRSGAG